jgi:hypothetical protein
VETGKGQAGGRGAKRPPPPSDDQRTAKQAKQSRGAPQAGGGPSRARGRGGRWRADNPGQRKAAKLSRADPAHPLVCGACRAKGVPRGPAREHAQADCPLLAASIPGVDGLTAVAPVRDRDEAAAAASPSVVRPFRPGVSMPRREGRVSAHGCSSVPTCTIMREARSWWERAGVRNGEGRVHVDAVRNPSSKHLSCAVYNSVTPLPG